MRKMQQHNPMVDMVQCQLEASMQLADAVFSGTEKIDRAVLDVTHQAVDGQLKFAKAIADIRDPSKMTELQSTMAHRPEKAMRSQQQIMAAFAEMQAEIGKSIQNYMEHVNQLAMARSAQAGQQTNSGIETADNAMFNPVISMLSVWEKAFKEVTSMANRNMMAARSSIESATTAASEAVSHATHPEETEELDYSERKHAGGHRRKS